MAKIWKWVTFGIALLCFGAAVYFWLESKSISTPLINILSASETQSVLNNDADHYYDKFHEVDYKVRNVKSKREYLAKIAKSGCDGDIEVVEKVTDCIEKVHNHLIPKISETIHGINIHKFLTTKWNIGFTCDKHYENGLPHTRGDVIILNNKNIQTRTISEVCKLLIHEKSHVYQKSEDMTKYLDEHYTEVKRKDYKDTKIPANPDTNDMVYRSKESNEVLQGKYNKKPKHFRDVKFTQNDHSLEHPFERIAYQMESLYEV